MRPLVPRRYVRSQPPSIAGGDAAYLKTELDRIGAALEDLRLLTPSPATEEPRDKAVPMVRLAMAPWRPLAGQEADAWVFWTGTEWKPL